MIEEFQITKCNTCKHEYINPIPNKDEILVGYSKFSKFNPNDNYFSILEGQNTYQIKNAKTILKDILRINSKLRSVLDFGCGSGFAMRFFRSKGYKVFGVEIGPWGKIASDKFDLQIVDELSKIKDQKFDIIISVDVFEHLFSPTNSLQQLMNYLNEEGIVVLQVPNVDSIHRRLTKSKWGLFLPPGHIHYFSKKSLESIFNRFGFEVLFSRTMFSSGFGFKIFGVKIKFHNLLLQPVLNFFKQGDLIRVYAARSMK